MTAAQSDQDASGYRHDVAAKAIDRDRVRIVVYGVRQDLDTDTAHALIDAMQGALREAAPLPF